MTLLSALISLLILQSGDICAEPMPGGVGEPAFCEVAEETTITTPYFSFDAVGNSFVGIDRDGNRAIVQPTIFKNPIQLYIEAHPLGAQSELMRQFERCGGPAAENDVILECDHSTSGIFRITRLHLGSERLVFAELNAGEIAGEELPAYRAMLDSITVDCILSDEELSTLKSNVRGFLRDELGEAFTYYDSEDSILDSVKLRDGSCEILIYPGGESDDGSMLLHGEGVVLFDRKSLTPSEVVIFTW